MKIKIAQKDIVGYIFMLGLAAACIAIGVRMLIVSHPASAIFSLVLGAFIIAATAMMVLRKE